MSLIRKSFEMRNGLLYSSLEKTKKICTGYEIFDAHCDTVQYFTGEKGSYDFLRKNNRAHIDLPRLKIGGVKVQIFALFIEPRFKDEGALKRCLHLLDAYHRTMESCPEDLVTVYNYSNLLEVRNTEKIAAFLFIEGGEALEKDLGILRELYYMGIRGVGLTWNSENEIAGAAMEGPGSAGLKSFGKEVVREMNRLGIIIDLAHISPRGFLDVLKQTDTPVIVSHANTAALCNHPRNLTDEQMKALRENNGVLGLSFYPPFIDHKKADLGRLLDHFEYAACIMGADHIGIGSDFDGIDIVLEELQDASFFPRLITGLRERGFKEEELRKILFDNFFRIVKETNTGGRNAVY